jgi:hypothetical protein
MKFFDSAERAMRQSSTETSWKVTCLTHEDAETLRQTLVERIDLDRILKDTIRVVEAGMEREQIEPHRLGDYFTAINVLPDAQADPTAFRIVFHRLPTAGRFWKDLMVNVLQEIESSPQKPTILRDSERLQMEGAGS